MALLSLTLFLCVSTNSLALYVLKSMHRKQEEIYLGQVGLSIVDILAAITGFLFLATFEIFSIQISPAMCFHKLVFYSVQVILQLSFWLFLATLLLHFCLCIDRIYAIAEPLRYRAVDKKYRMRQIFFFSVMLAALVTGPLVGISQHCNSGPHCEQGRLVWGWPGIDSLSQYSCLRPMRESRVLCQLQQSGYSRQGLKFESKNEGWQFGRVFQLVATIWHQYPDGENGGAETLVQQRRRNTRTAALVVLLEAALDLLQVGAATGTQVAWSKTMDSVTYAFVILHLCSGLVFPAILNPRFRRELRAVIWLGTE